MWKSKYKCFVIKSRYICTKDSDLATVYALVKQALSPSVDSDSFGILLKDAICALERFAGHRRLTEESRYIDISMSIKWAYDTYDISDEDFQRTQVLLYDCLYSLQELEECADKISPIAVPDTKGYDPRATHRELRIRATHKTRDMSVGNTYDTDYYVDIDRLNDKKTSYIDLAALDGGQIEVVEATADAVTLRWGERVYCIRSGEEVNTDASLIDNQLLSLDSLQLTFAYREIPDYIGIWNMIASLGHDEKERKTERCILEAQKNEILHFIEIAIKHGNTGLYVAKALLNIYNDWSTCEISDLYTFQKKLLEGIEHGCLAPDNYYGWEWLEVAAKYNNPACFMEDMDLYYEVLDTAASHGVVEAIDIMSSIWEPEQIIEED